MKLNSIDVFNKLINEVDPMDVSVLVEFTMEELKALGEHDRVLDIYCNSFSRESMELWYDIRVAAEGENQEGKMYHVIEYVVCVKVYDTCSRVVSSDIA